MGSKNSGKKEMKAAVAIMQQQMAKLEALGVPTIEAQQIVLQNPELVGLLEAEQLGPSAMEGVNVDPRMREAQFQALEEMAGLSQTGLGAEDIAAMNRLRRDVSSQAQAEQASILQNAAETGNLDSGNTLLAQLNANQAQANRASSEADQMAARASQARREALGMKANLATSMGQDDFNRKSSIAQAQDAISRFNSQNRQNVNQYNLDARQNIANQKAANANQQQIHNKALIQQKFQNDFQKASGQAGVASGIANMYQGMGQAKAQGAANLNSGLLSAGAGIGAAFIKGDDK